MARKSKIESGKQIDPAGLDPATRATDGIVETKPKQKPTAKAPGKKKPAPGKKAASAAEPAASKKPAAAKTPAGPSDEEIRIRAYFIAERRLQFSLPGDSAHDWIEARRQLVEEATGGS